MKPTCNKHFSDSMAKLLIDGVNTCPDCMQPAAEHASDSSWEQIKLELAPMLEGLREELEQEKRAFVAEVLEGLLDPQQEYVEKSTIIDRIKEFKQPRKEK